MVQTSCRKTKWPFLLPTILLFYLTSELYIELYQINSSYILHNYFALQFYTSANLEKEIDDRKRHIDLADASKEVYNAFIGRRRPE